MAKPYRNLFGWRQDGKTDGSSGSRRRRSSASESDASTNRPSQPQAIPQRSTGAPGPDAATSPLSTLSTDDFARSPVAPLPTTSSSTASSSSSTPSAGPSRLGAALTGQPYLAPEPPMAPLINVGPSNASVVSGRPSTIATISTYQSSVFSRNAPSFGTISSFGSTTPSGGNWKTPLEGLAEEGDAASMGQLSSSAQSESGRLMRVVGPQQMSSLVDDTTSARQRPQTASSAPTSSYPRVTVSSSRNLLPDVPSAISPPAISEHSYWPDSRGSFSSSSSSTPRYARRPPTANEELKSLASDLYSLVDQAMNKTVDPVRAATHMSQQIRTAMSLPCFDSVSPGEITLYSEPALSRIIKVVLHFSDNLLTNSQEPRFHAVRALYHLGVKLKLISPALGTVPVPKNYAVGSVAELPSQRMVDDIMSGVLTSDSSVISEQEGSFIAPVLRGLSPEFAVLSLVFGFPSLTDEHRESTSTLYNTSPDVHFYCENNSIRACSSQSRFVPPFRVLDDATSPPMSMSISTDTATSLSGTLGGYIYPKIDVAASPELASYARSTFAITCAHVCLSENPATPHPNVSIPSPVLINMYRNALAAARNKYPAESTEKVEFDRAITDLDETFPSKESRNQPKEAFGQVIWGERTVIKGSISDIAIVKCNTQYKCHNFLGNDVAFSEYDPGLMFGGLYVRKIVHKMHPGMKVFKYGSTSKYTTGKLNGPRIVYWADGKLQSSEFVVSSDSPMFASGGDSGAWILQKSEDILDEDTNTVVDGSDRNGPCLGVVGMLHSYDGERKEFGLFTPMDSILERLREVTNIKWGVVGISDSESEHLLGGSDSSDSGDDAGGNSSDGEGK